MRIISFLALFLLIIACNNSAKKKEDLNDTAKTPEQMPEKIILPDTLFTGFGTEPFWSVYVVADSKIVFHPADGPDVEVPYVPVAITDSISSGYNSATGGTSIELKMIKKDCSDGMSETTHPYQVTLVVNKKRYHGCGRMGK